MEAVTLSSCLSNGMCTVTLCSEPIGVCALSLMTESVGFRTLHCKFFFDELTSVAATINDLQGGRYSPPIKKSPFLNIFGEMSGNTVSLIGGRLTLHAV